MRELTYESIMDYYRCPLLYHLKHNLNLNRQKSESVLYQSYIVKVAMYFYFQVMNGTIPSRQKVQDKWYKMWAKDKNTVEDILFQQTQHKDTRNKLVSGIQNITKFYEEEIKLQFTPILVDKEVRVRVGDYMVEGNIDLIREMVVDEKKSNIELTRFTASRYKTTDFLLRHDFKLTFQAYAFNQLFETYPDAMFIRNLRLGKTYVTSRGRDEFKRFEATINNVGRAIKEERYHPIIAQHCRYCDYSDVCDKFKFN